MPALDLQEHADPFAEMFVRHGGVSEKTMAKLLKDHDCYSQAPTKSVEGAQHPDRNAQFEHINAKAQDCIERKGCRHQEEGASWATSRMVDANGSPKASFVRRRARLSQ